MKSLLLVLLVLSSTCAHAALNKWVDEHGKVHYSDQPPPSNVKAQILRPSVAPPSADADPASTGNTEELAPAEAISEAEREAEARRRQLEEAAAAQKAAEEKARADARKMNCEISQQNLRTMQSDLRLSEINAQGERIYIDDQQRKQRIEKLKLDIEDYCD